MATFNLGDEVVSLVNAQGLVEGETYRVREPIDLPSPFGGCTDYVLEDKEGEELRVVNGHLVLKLAPARVMLTIYVENDEDARRVLSALQSLKRGQRVISGLPIETLDWDPEFERVEFPS